MTLKRGIILTVICIFIANKMHAQSADSIYNEGPKKYIAPSISKPELKFFQGFTVSADLFGPIQYLMSDYGNIEGAIRLNLKNTYFPIIEAGLSSCETIDSNTDIKYSTTAPYGRIGCDINFLKNKYQENRLFVGIRYGFSKYKYDYLGPTVTDPIWNGEYNLDIKDSDATSHWGELVMGVQVKIWRSLHMGWSIRLKKEFHTSSDDSSKPCYIPGYGNTSSGASWGGTYSLIFDVNWGMKNRK